MNELSRSHDGFFKKLMSDTQRVRDYLYAYLPEHIKTIVDFTTLEQDTESYVDEKLKQSFSDVVFKIDTKTNSTINLCFLFEHKSYIDEKAPFQMLHYISAAMLKRAENNKPQRLIIPILFYHGQTSWAYKNLSQHFESLDDGLKVYLPRFEYLYHNFQSKPDEEIKSVFDNLTAASLLAMKHFYNKGYLLENIRVFLFSSIDERGNLYKPLVVYLFDKIPKDNASIQMVMNNTPAPHEAEFISILDAYKIEGKDEAIRQTCINMIREGLDNNLICSVLEVDEEYVKQIRQELQE
ncbi:MAG: hypothetical protein GVY26_18740 [Bacteroidetes bacterium]|jgi:predicted transposase/invertase (TIGR01784 family)|nr:hypothetical protein [Bacteroidota bacterium]